MDNEEQRQGVAYSSNSAGAVYSQGTADTSHGQDNCGSPNRMDRSERNESAGGQGSPYINSYSTPISNAGSPYYGHRSAANDHTDAFERRDIAENKLFAIAAYLMGIVGIIVALLAAKSSDYVMFHVRQALKLSVCTMLLVILAVPFVLLSFVPYIGILFRFVVGVLAVVEIGIMLLRIIAFFQVCDGKAKEPIAVGGIFND